jgi:membrane protease YdiL (CAAX protease family)
MPSRRTLTDPNHTYRVLAGAVVIAVFVAIAGLETWSPLRGPFEWVYGHTKELISHESLWAIVYSVEQILIVCVCALTAMWLFGGSVAQALESLGVRRGVIRGLLVGAVATLPMPILFAISGHAKFNSEIAVQMGVFGLVSGVAEEVRFRGFAFGLLYRKLRLGFWVSIILPTVFFGLGHLYEVHGIRDALAIVALTGFGSVWFGWLYVRWEYNLWVPITIHTLMNSWWSIFNVSQSALGGHEGNDARLLTIALSVVLTLWHCGWDWRKAFLHIRPEEPDFQSPLALGTPGPVSTE